MTSVEGRADRIVTWGGTKPAGSHPRMTALKQKVALLWPHLDERARRLFAASEARQLGHGGVSLVSRACGLSRVTITKGVEELSRLSHSMVSGTTSFDHMAVCKYCFLTNPYGPHLKNVFRFHSQTADGRPPQRTRSRRDR